MRYPVPLGQNGTIGFVAPSFGCGVEPYRTMFDHGLQTFQAKGHSLDLGPNCYEEKGIGINKLDVADIDCLGIGRLNLNRRGLFRDIPNLFSLFCLSQNQNCVLR